MMNVTKLKNGISLERYYTEDSPDSVGSVAFWESEINEVVGRMNIPELYPNLVIRIIDMYHKVIQDRRDKGLVTLEDIKPSTKECEYGAGLYWAGKFDTDPHVIEIGIYRQVPHQPDAKVAPVKIVQKDLEDAKGVIGHEMGHHYMRMCGYGKFAVTDAQKFFSKEFDQMRVKHIESPQEAGAEMFQAVCGIDEIVGKYSDKNPHNMTDGQVSFVKNWYKLTKLTDRTVFGDLKYSRSGASWVEYWITVPLFGNSIKLFPKLTHWLDRDNNHKVWRNGRWEVLR